MLDPIAYSQFVVVVAFVVVSFVAVGGFTGATVQF